MAKINFYKINKTEKETVFNAIDTLGIEICMCKEIGVCFVIFKNLFFSKLFQNPLQSI